MNPSIHNYEKTLQAARTILEITRSIELAASPIIQLVTNDLKFDWGTFWKLQPSDKKLFPIAIWGISTVKAAKLEALTKERRLALSEGTAGLVWKNLKPVESIDLVKDMCLPRSLAADQAGFRCGVWMVVKSEKTVFGVLELLGQFCPLKSDDYLMGIEHFGLNLGNIFQQYNLQT